MSDPLRAGQTRSQPDSESPFPIGKKPRLETSYDTTDSVGKKLAANTSLKKSAKKEARKAKKKGQHVLPEPYSSDDVLWRDVISVLGQDIVDNIIEEGTEWDSPFEFREEVEVEVHSLSSNGEALAIAAAPRQNWVVVVPFSLPGEKVRARVYRSSRLHSVADLVSIITPNNSLRDSSRVKCKYFGQCAGCQYQMLSYQTQLDLKRDVVVKAYRNFSDLSDSLIPPVLETIASPLQYGYRTKLTPHFEAPPRKYQQNRQATTDDTGNVIQPEWLKIGFNHIGKRHVMDIEDCPIATPILMEAYGPIRENTIRNIYTYKKGVSLLLRESIEVSSDTDGSTTTTSIPINSTAEKHICISDQKAIVRERVGDMLFEYPGGSFFQNNNSVLVPLTDYVRDAIFISDPTHMSFERPTHLVDAYCGAGLFAIKLSPYFDTIAGIELSSDSIKFATRNAKLNDIPEGKCTFRSGDAANIFAAVPDFPPEYTVLILDPPRKGCDENFIEQLLAFKAKTVVYVSCNVHTQARDVGMIIKRSEKVQKEGGALGKYVLKSLRGFDLFPQTAHVEGVAVLQLV